MKPTALLCRTICFVLLCAASHGTTGATARLTISIRTETGEPLPGFPVRASTFLRHLPDEGFGTDKHLVLTNLTDTRGLADFAVPCLTGEVGYGIPQPPEGFYWDRGARIRFTNAIAGQWMPSNPVVDLRIKRKLNPIPLYARRISIMRTKLPILDTTAGFDLTRAAWTSPHGEGAVADLLFKLSARTNGTTRNGYPKYEAALEISFSSPYDGIQSLYATPLTGSVLRLPHHAPEEGYETNLLRRSFSRDDDRPVKLREDQNYFFRIRTQTNEQGRIVSALYGKIHGDFEWAHTGEIGFTYYLNPTPNDRNLEFDPSRNLFTDLKRGEEVREP
jgi:hypothetical protein